MVCRYQPQRQLWGAHHEENFRCSPEKEMRNFSCGVDGDVQSFEPETDVGLFVYTARRNKGRLYEAFLLKISTGRLRGRNNHSFEKQEAPFDGERKGLDYLRHANDKFGKNSMI